MSKNISAPETKGTDPRDVTASELPGTKRGLDVTTSPPIHSIDSYQTIYAEDLLSSTGTILVGLTRSYDAWLGKKISLAGAVYTNAFANISNNASYADLDAAWADRASLVFGGTGILSDV